MICSQVLPSYSHKHCSLINSTQPLQCLCDTLSYMVPCSASGKGLGWPRTESGCCRLLKIGSLFFAGITRLLKSHRERTLRPVSSKQDAEDARKPFVRAAALIDRRIKEITAVHTSVHKMPLPKLMLDLKARHRRCDALLWTAEHMHLRCCRSLDTAGSPFA